MAINFLSTEAIQALDKPKRNEYLTWLSNAAGGAPSGHWQSLINLADKGDWGEINYQLPSMQRALTEPYAKAQEYGQRVKEYNASGQTGGAVTGWGNEAKAAYDSFAGRYDSAPSWFKTPQMSYDELIGKLPAVNPYSAQGVVGSQEQAALRPPASMNVTDQTIKPMQPPQASITSPDQSLRPPQSQMQNTAQQSMATLVNAQGQRVVVPVGSQQAQQYFGQGFRLEGAGEAPNRPVTMISPTGQRVRAENTQHANELMASGFRPEVAPAGQVQQPLRPPSPSSPSPDYRSEAISNPIGSGTIPFVPVPNIGPASSQTTYSPTVPAPTSPTPPTAPTSPTPAPPQNLSRAAFDEWMKLQQQPSVDNTSQSALDAIIAQQANLAASRDLGIADVRNQAIAMPFITGQSAALERSAAAKMGALESQSVPLKLKIAQEQAKRAAASDVAKAKYEYETEQEKLAQDRSKGVEVGGALVDPTTGRVIYQGASKEPSLTGDAAQFEYAKKQGYKGSFLDYQRETANLKTPSSDLTPGQIQSTINQISSQFDNEPIVKDFNQIAQGYQLAQTIANKQNPTAADDQALIYAFAKAMDPGSVVREGEYATVQKYAQSWAQTFGFNAQRIFSNTKFLDSTAVKNMVESIASKYGVSRSAYDNVSNEYNRRIDDAKRGVIGGSITNYSQNYPVNTPQNTQRTPTISDVENFIGQSLTPEKRAKVQEAITDFPGLSAEKIAQSLGFKTEQQTSLKGPSGTGMRTDRHNNPTAFTTDIARVAGLKEGVDYTQGDSFNNGQYHTAKLLGDPIAQTIKVIDRIGFYTQGGNQRWSHTAMPKSQWDSMSYEQKKNVIAQMYKHEGGKTLTNLFA